MSLAKASSSSTQPASVLISENIMKAYSEFACSFAVSVAAATCCFVGVREPAASERPRRIVNRRHEVVYRNARAVGEHVSSTVGVDEDVVIADRA